MSTLTRFITMIVGDFNNDEQVERYQKEGRMDYPKAQHVNTVCNDKIVNIPSDFNGIFLLEESYYTLNDKTNPMPHLFLISDTPNGIQLESYEIPQGYDKMTFTYANLNQVEFTQLKKIEKFQPLVYKEVGNTFYGKSESMFTPILKFTIEETFSDELLLVSEIFEANGKRTFGYDDPIEYKRVKR